MKFIYMPRDTYLRCAKNPKYRRNVAIPSNLSITVFTIRLLTFTECKVYFELEYGELRLAVTSII